MPPKSNFWPTTNTPSQPLQKLAFWLRAKPLNSGLSAAALLAAAAKAPLATFATRSLPGLHAFHGTIQLARTWHHKRELVLFWDRPVPGVRQYYNRT